MLSNNLLRITNNVLLNLLNSRVHRNSELCTEVVTIGYEPPWNGGFA